MFETSGSRPPKARVIEVAVVQGSLKDEITYETSFLINAAGAGAPVTLLV